MLQYRVKRETDGHERVFREDQLGHLAMTAPALAVLALRFDGDVLSAGVERLDGAHFRLAVFPPLPVTRSGEPDADAAALMARVNETLEE